MKKIISLILSFLLILTLVAGCGEKSAIDLTGEWIQSNNTDENMYQYAEIAENTITIYWVFKCDDGDFQYLYWSGSFDAPKTEEEPYSWESVSNASQTNSELLVSQDETKTFTYENNQISYEGSISGTQTDFILKKSTGSDLDIDSENERLASALSEIGTEDASSYITNASFSDTYNHDFKNIDEVEEYVDACAEPYLLDVTYSVGCNNFDAMVIWTYDFPFSAMAYLSTQGFEIWKNSWDSLSSLMIELCAEIDEKVAEKYEDYHVSVTLLNEKNPSRSLMIAYGNEIIYDIVEESESLSVKSTGDAHIYDGAKAEALNPSYESAGYYSLLEVPSDEVTEEALNDWYFNYVTQTDFNYYIILYSDRNDNLGVYSNGNTVVKDTYLTQNDSGVYKFGDDLLATEYEPVDGKLVVYKGEGETQPDKSAVEAAQEYMAEHTKNRDRGNLIYSLMLDGYSAEEATEAAENCGVDWYEVAVESAQSYLQSLSASYDELVEALEDDEFTQDEIDYAIENCGVDWNEQAVAKANEYLSFGGTRSRENIIDCLKTDGFTDEQANYGADHCDGSWNK